MTTTRQFLEFLNLFKRFEAASEDPTQWSNAAVKQLTDAQLTTAVYAAAQLFSTVKQEAQKRGIWESLKKQKV